MKNNILMIYKKEMSAFFNGPVAYITLVVFLSIGGWLFTSTFFLRQQSDLRQLFDLIPLLFIFFIPAISMSLVAKEKQTGTMEFLVTLPVSDTEIVLGKFFSALALIGVFLLFTLVHFFTLLIVGNNIDIGALLSGYMGLFLVGAVYASIGTFGSASTNNQIVAFIVSLLIIFIFFIMGKVLMLIPPGLGAIVQYLSIDYHLNNISRGVIDTRNLIYFGSVIVFFLTLSVRFLEMRKWR